MTSLTRHGCFLIVMMLALAGRPALAEDTIKIGYVDPLSGPFAVAGNEFLKVFGYILGMLTPRAARSARNSNWCRSTTSCSRPRR